MKPVLKSKRIFVNLLLAYAIGAGLGIAFPFVQVLLPLAIIMLMVTLILVGYHKHQNNAYQWGALLYLWITFLGLLNTHWANPTIHTAHYNSTANTPGLLIVQVDDVPREKTNTYQIIAEVKGRKQGDSIVPLTGKVMLLLPIDSHTAMLKYGDELAVNSKLETISAPLNPYEFNYAQYLANQHIHYQLRPKPNRWYATGNNTGNNVYSWITKIRYGALSTLAAYVEDPALYGVASAMLLGDRDNLDTETRHRYTITGSMHVLAVSGMHVGLLCYLLWLIVAPLKAMNKKWLRLAILLGVVWFYAILTGLSPSVLRASLMFSLYAIGDTIKRKPDSLNIIAASALILLLIEPLQLLDVGFQLSYLAVLGIIFFYQPLRNLLLVKYKAPRVLWEGTCISIAAQAATLPLVIYYFHQIPLYALLANAAMLIVAPIVMLSGFMLLVLSWLPGINWLLGKMLYCSLWLMNELLGMIAQLPNNSWKALYPTPVEMTFMLAIVISLMIATQRRMVKPLMLASGLAVILLGIGNLKLYEHKQQKQFIVYQFSQQSVLAALTGLDSEIWADSLALADTTKMEQSIYPFLHAHGSERPVTYVMNTFNSNKYGLVGKMRYALLRDYSRRNIPTEPLQLDYLIIANNPNLSMIQVQQVYNAKVVVFDGSNNYKAAERWMQECKVLGLNCHNTRNGAFIASW